MPKITFIVDNKEYCVDAVVGDTLLVTAKKNNVPLFGGCDGACVCGTCHVLIDENHISKAGEIEYAEDDLLDCLPKREENSRLACQVIVTEDMDNAIVTVIR